ncbi:unnamed protein product [Rotaria sp. Silwood1]|nr:unnamed protein product [Rotaria sp. Silwood1]CAF3358663.1 unnamed protein product [Rotaria sp. Silwood1]CAF3381873.1 unnamed protein product [Rotaria sp. Silwood1]CAF4606222.1 unnamed protein product [Rotaria sp. Silwood1]CAF4850068.1 unnamed protein product [Rotaria sp. Silwood1]
MGLLLGLLSLFYVFRWCPRPLRSLIQQRFGHQYRIDGPNCRQSNLFEKPKNSKRTIVPEGTYQYRQQYIKNNNDKSINRPRITSMENTLLSSSEPFFDKSLSSIEFRSSTTKATLFGSPSRASLLPAENISFIASPITPLDSSKHHYDSILLQKYSMQIQSQRV